MQAYKQYNNKFSAKTKINNINKYMYVCVSPAHIE